MSEPLLICHCRKGREMPLSATTISVLQSELTKFWNYISPKSMQFRPNCHYKANCCEPVFLIHRLRPATPDAMDPMTLEGPNCRHMPPAMASIVGGRQQASFMLNGETMLGF
jgi:hypothetical protein